MGKNKSKKDKKCQKNGANKNAKGLLRDKQNKVTKIKSKLKGRKLRIENKRKNGE